MSEAYLVIREHAKAALDDLLDPDEIDIAPGRFAGRDSDLTSGTYTVIQNLEFNMPKVHTDGMQLKIYHVDYMTLQEMVFLLLERFNLEHAKDNLDLYTEGIDEDIKFLSVDSKATANGNDSFIDGVEYFWQQVDILFRYVDIGL